MEAMPKPKRYFSKIPGSHYTFSDGHQIFFLHGKFDFDPADYPEMFVSQFKDHPLNGKPKWKVYQDELEYLVNNNNPLVFDQGHIPADAILPPELDPSKNAHSEASVQKQDIAMGATGKVRETGDLNNGVAGTVSDANASTVDRELQQVVLGTTGPGASRADQLRAEAAARTQAQQQAQTQVTQNKNGMS